jgi:hypothetical protein
VAVTRERMTVKGDREVVVYLIGMRINRPWKLHKWLPVFLAMPRMLRELSRDPDSGLLGYRLIGLTVVQYWDSFGALERYAVDKQRAHLPAMRDFFRRAGGDVGIWHEVYRVPAGHYEAIYTNMPPFGLGKALGVVPAGKAASSARERMAGALRTDATSQPEGAAR